MGAHHRTRVTLPAGVRGLHPHYALGAVAIAEPVLLLQAPRDPTGFAAVVLAVQAVGALLAFALALRRDSAAGQPAVSPELA